MDSLIAKLTNLSYELFGVILPGIVTMLFVIAWWEGIGPIAPILSFGAIPELTAKKISEIIEILNSPVGIGIFIPALFFAYFVGHIILWISRSGKPDDKALSNSWIRVREALFFRIPKSQINFDPKFDPLFKAVLQTFIDEKSLPSPSWQEIFPVLKCLISKNLSYSLVGTYQNKYTFHRSVTSASAILFWLCLASIITGPVIHCFFGVSPHWDGLIALISISLILVWGFSDSYSYNWKMFGNTIVTESYAILYAQKYDNTRQ